MAISAGIFVRTSELYTDLERTVDVRTAELRVRERELSAMLAVRRTILDAIPDTVCLLNGLRVDYVNDAGAKFFGQSAGDIAGSVITDHVVESQRVTAEQRLEAIAGFASTLTAGGAPIPRTGSPPSAWARWPGSCWSSATSGAR